MTAMKKVAIFMPPALSALLLWAAFPPLGETANVAFALVPLLVVARLCSPKRSALLWFVGGFLFWFGTLSWMPAIIKNNGPWPLVVLGWAGLAAACAGYFALYGWMAARVWRRYGRWGILAEPILWAGCEWMRATLFTGFAWNFLGTAVGQVPSLATPARLGGVYLVSALVVLLNGVFATLACRVIAGMRRGAGPAETENGGKWRRQLIRSAETAVSLAVILLVFWLSQPGNSRLSTPNSQLLRVALVQRNAPCIFSAGRQRENPYEAYGQLLEVAAVARPDLVVWGESGMSEFGRVDGERARLAAAHFSEMLGGAALFAVEPVLVRSNVAVARAAHERHKRLTHRDLNAHYRRDSLRRLFPAGLAEIALRAAVDDSVGVIGAARIAAAATVRLRKCLAYLIHALIYLDREDLSRRRQQHARQNSERREYYDRYDCTHLFTASILLSRLSTLASHAVRAATYSLSGNLSIS